MNAYALAYVSVRVLALWCLINFVTFLPSIPQFLDMMRDSLQSVDSPTMKQMMFNSTVAQFGHFFAQGLLGAFLWSKADFVAKKITSNGAARASFNRYDRGLGSLLLSCTGWFVIALFVDDALTVIVKLSLENPPVPTNVLHIVSPFIVLAIGILLVIGKDRLMPAMKYLAGDSHAMDDGGADAEDERPRDP